MALSDTEESKQGRIDTKEQGGNLASFPVRIQAEEAVNSFH